LKRGLPSIHVIFPAFSFQLHKQKYRASKQNMGAKLEREPEVVEGQEIDLDGIMKEVNATIASDPPALRDVRRLSDKQNLLLNTSAFGGMNIYRSLPQVEEGGFICVDIPKGTWIYKATEFHSELPEEYKTKEGGSWFGSVEVAQEYSETFGASPGASDIYFLATQVNESEDDPPRPLRLMLLNRRRNIRKFLTILSQEQKPGYENIIKKIKNATGVDLKLSERLDQLRSLQELGGDLVSSLLFLTTRGLFVPFRQTTGSDDSGMLAEFCRYWREHNLHIDGYIAPYIERSSGVMHEELAICYSSFGKLNPSKTISAATAEELIKKHSVLSNQWYIWFKKQLASRYKTTFLLFGLSAAINHWQKQRAKEVEERMKKRWEDLKALCTEHGLETKELMRSILWLSAFNAPASIMFDKSGDLKSSFEMCVDIAKFDPKMMTRTSDILRVFTILMLFLTPPFLAHFLALFLSSTRPSSFYASALAKQETKRTKFDEKIPKIDNFSFAQRFRMRSYFGAQWADTIKPFSRDEIRMHILDKNKSIPAFVFVNANGDERNKDEIIGVLSVLG
jgi:hypothetical protein